MSEKYWAVRENLHSYMRKPFIKMSSSSLKMDGVDQSLLLRYYVPEYDTYVEN